MKDIWLIRNNKHFKLYNFEDGRPFEPDFILFMTKNENEESIQYQIFIESRNEHPLRKDEWKESFLKELRKEHKLEELWQNKKYIIWGLLFYADKQGENRFEQDLNEIINSEKYPKIKS